ncbi:MAG: HNH endonuclease [Candidatus Margulisbacteria bacterium]|nr:HNH endonuclease [Candidatus Margulisiibacteriota bacterium]MBU1021448.1 HNH endonuclease [Candidatus Margulisiibacteriota bacterium]MBU1728369.1 HNH endonuclease [Candidatus Margulisiibacteriota bacterium]MBU1955888.1 HNH endonuclease [Candidatus Margulisiibacteriota bacterium]
MTEVNPHNIGYSKVLVLNATFAPINICSWRRAVTLLYKDKATLVEESGKLLNNKYSMPFVIRLVNYVSIPYNNVVLTRKNIYLRDNHTCQYCGKSGNLTIDHVIPKSRGGNDTWENIVTCCVRCNNRKGDKSLEEIGLSLRKRPYRPPSTLYLHMTRLSTIPRCWNDYFFKQVKES